MTLHKLPKLRAAVLWPALLAALCARADEPGQPLFASDAVLEARLVAPLTTLMRERSDTDYLEGTFSYTDAAGAEHTLDLKLRARGRYRRQPKTCDLPPIRLNFRKQQVDGTEFAGQDKLKLVTHCRYRRPAFDQYVLKEYLAYRIFNLLTEYSFRARLLKIDYVDSGRDGENVTAYAFVIEHDDRLAERIGAEAASVPRIDYSQLDAQQANLVAVFQYLIGNTDYSMVAGAEGDCCHNIVLFRSSGNYLPIPYDFDFSGLVNAPYAEPNPRLRIRTVLRRLYRGSCRHIEHLESNLAQFRSGEASIRELVLGIEGMDARVRDTALRYVGGFYDDIAEAKTVERLLTKRCLGAS